MKPEKPIELNNSLIKQITAEFPTKLYKTKSTLFYEGQIPISGYLIINGAVEVSHKKKYKKILSVGTLIGVKELLKKIPSQISAEIYPNTEVCFLDKTTIIEIFKKDTVLANFFKDLLGKRE